jgi:TonB-linked SusC/RagA family outer membrane protein
MKHLNTTLFLLLFSLSLFAQSQYSGQVLDENSQPLPGVSILVVGTQNGTSTDFDGNYLIEANEGDQLQFSFMGYTTQTLTLTTQTTNNISIDPDAKALDEIVVVGYGVQKKSDLTGAISTVKPEDLQNKDVATVDQALQGQMAGVTVTQASGTPGEAPSVSIRGIGTLNNADPLYVVDGMMVDDITYLNARDIESLQVLKDASSSAIYGSRGANGVIIVTTKKGKSGEGKVNFNAYYGFQNFAHTPELTTASEFALLNNEARLAAGLDPKYSDPSSYGKGTDWLGAISQKNAPIQNYDLSFSGGNEKSTYFISGAYMKQDGIIKKSNYDRISVRINSESQVKSWLKIGENLTVSSSNQGTILENDDWNNLLVTPLTNSPLQPVYNPDGSYSVSDNQVNNPVAKVDNTINNANNFRVIGNLFGEIEFLKGLTFKSNLGVQYGVGEDDDYSPVYYVSPTEGNAINSLFKGHNKDKSIEWTNMVNYVTTIAEKHDVSAIIGTSVFMQKYEWDGLTVTNLPTDNEDNRVIDNSPNLDKANVYGSFLENNQLSYFGRVNYAFDSKYLLTANFRADGSSKFGDENKWGYFPSFSAGWKISEEGFMENASVISNLKFRAGWGQIGNQGSIPAYTQTTLATGSKRYVWGNQIVSGVAFESVGNNEMKWETTATTNLGLDFGFLKGKLSGSAEYYVKNTTDMILQVPVPGQTGIESFPWQNAGEMKNSGIEVSINWKDNVGDFEYSIGGNFTTIKNEVVSLGGNNEFIDGADYRNWGYITRTVVGRPIANFYGLVAEGLFQNQTEIDEYYANNDDGIPSGIKPGDVRYKDINGDGKVGEEDYDFIGNPIPDFTYAFTGSLAYKGIDFSFMFNGVYGNEIYNGTNDYLLNSTAYWNLSKEMMNRWTGEGSTNNPKHARMNSKDTNNSKKSSRYIEDGSYLRLQNVQLGYSLPKSLLSKMKVDRLRVYVSGQNLYTFTKYMGYDPEVGGYGLDRGLDRATYPIPRTVTFGINLGF